MEKEIKELQDKLDALKLKYEQKQPFKDGDVVEFIEKPSIIIKITNKKNGEGYGIDYDDKWGIGENFTFDILDHEWQLSTTEKWLEVCKNEAVKLGLVEGAKIDRSVFNNDEYYNLTLLKNVCPEYELFHNGNTLECYGKVIMQNGIWAEVMKPDKTLRELFKDWGACELIAIQIEKNPEAYIKAINNLKK